MKWLITGGCGFIGISLIRNLLREEGHAIRVLDNLSVGRREDLGRITRFNEINPDSMENHLSPGNVELIVGDILDESQAIKASKDIDIIVHLAANTGVGPSVESPRQDMEANVIGTFNMLEAARQNNVQHFIFASSGAPVGECEPPIHEELAPHPVSPYGASKLAGEGYCSTYFHTFDLKTVILRFGNVYGPGSGHKNSVVAKFIKQALDGETSKIYGDGTQTRDFIYIDDLVDAIRKAANPEAFGRQRSSLAMPWGETFQIATNREHTVNEIAKILKNELALQYEIKMKIKYGEPRRGDVKRNFSDTSKAWNIMGWKADVNLMEGIQKTLKWFIEQRRPSSQSCPEKPYKP